MKKKLIALVVCAVFCMGLAACGSGGSSASGTSSASSAASAAATPIELNKTVSTDDFELTLTGVEWTEELAIEETEEGGQLLSAEANGAETMVVVKGTFKNKGNSDYAPGVAKVDVTLNGDTELSGYGTTAKMVSSPGETQDVFYLAYTTNDVKDSFKSGKMTISFFNQTIKDEKSVSYSGSPIASYVLEYSAGSLELEDIRVFERRISLGGIPKGVPPFLLPLLAYVVPWSS